MNKDIVKNAIICLKNMKIEDTTYQVARDIVLAEYEELKDRNNRAIEYIEKNSYTTLETIDDINYFIVRLDKCVDLLDILKGVDK